MRPSRPPKIDEVTLRRERRMVRLYAYVTPFPILGLFALAATDTAPCGPRPCSEIIAEQGPGVLLHAMTGSLLGGILGTLTLVLLVQALRWQHRLARHGGGITWF